MLNVSCKYGKGGDCMGKPVRAFEVENIQKVDTTKYRNGDIFITDRSAGILINGKIKLFSHSQGLKKSDVQKMIDETLKKGVDVDG